MRSLEYSVAVSYDFVCDSWFKLCLDKNTDLKKCQCKRRKLLEGKDIALLHEEYERMKLYGRVVYNNEKPGNLNLYSIQTAKLHDLQNGLRNVRHCNVCTKCNAKFSNESALKNHISGKVCEAIHQCRVQNCNMAGKLFTRASLKCHQRVHQSLKYKKQKK